MKFIIETWSIKRLMDVLDSGNLNLNPPYQRNPIWTKSTQKYLIQSINKGHPIPNLFLYKVNDTSFEMVDGQQRTRAIKLYKSTDDINFLEDDSKYKSGAFLDFEISIIIITKIEEDEFIEEFYHMVNSSGIKLNRPETLKAQYFDKQFLKLVEEITVDPNFQQLSIVPVNSQKRMLDRDLVEELCALIIFGITDKKNQVVKIYENDIDNNEANRCRGIFNQILDHINRFNVIQPIKSTRYRQRNDFYTLFSFLKDNLSLDAKTLDYFYVLLLQLEKGFRPSRSGCPILSEYAFNCVSQSNSAKARSIRLEIFNTLFLNNGDEPNPGQQEVKSYYSIDGDVFIKNGSYLTFNSEILGKAIDIKESQNL